MDKETVKHMLSLARKQRESPLSQDEALELAALRIAYMDDFRAGFKQQLDQIYIEQDDGSFQKLRQKTISPQDKENPDEK